MKLLFSVPGWWLALLVLSAALIGAGLILDH